MDSEAEVVDVGWLTAKAMDIQVYSKGTFFKPDNIRNSFRILVNSMKNPSKITSMNSIRDIFTKMR